MDHLHQIFFDLFFFLFDVLFVLLLWMQEHDERHQDVQPVVNEFIHSIGVHTDEFHTFEVFSIEAEPVMIGRVCWTFEK